MRSSVVYVGFRSPRSIPLTKFRCNPHAAASPSCESPRRLLDWRTASPSATWAADT